MFVCFVICSLLLVNLSLEGSRGSYGRQARPGARNSYGRSGACTWPYYKYLLVDSTSGASDTLLAYTYKVKFPATDSVYIHARADLADVWFYSLDPVTALDYFLILADSTFYVEMDTVQNRRQDSILVEYGCATATSRSNGGNTFIQFDDFSTDDTNYPDANADSFYSVRADSSAYYSDPDWTDLPYTLWVPMVTESRTLGAWDSIFRVNANNEGYPGHGGILSTPSDSAKYKLFYVGSKRVETVSQTGDTSSHIGFAYSNDIWGTWTKFSHPTTGWVIDHGSDPSTVLFRDSTRCFYNIKRATASANYKIGYRSSTPACVSWTAEQIAVAPRDTSGGDTSSYWRSYRTNNPVAFVTGTYPTDTLWCAFSGEDKTDPFVSGKSCVGLIYSTTGNAPFTIWGSGGAADTVTPILRYSAIRSSHDSLSVSPVAIGKVGATWYLFVEQSNVLSAGKASLAVYTATVQWNFTKSSALLPSGDGQQTPALGHQAQFNLFLDPISGKYIPTFSTPGGTSQGGDPPLIGKFVLRDTTAFTPKWKTKTLGYNLLTNLETTTNPLDSTCAINLAEARDGILRLSPEIDVRRNYEGGLNKASTGISIRLDTTTSANNFAVVLRLEHYAYNETQRVDFGVAIGGRDSLFHYEFSRTFLKNGYAFYVDRDTLAGALKKMSATASYASITNTGGTPVSRSTMQNWHYMECKYPLGGRLPPSVSDTATAEYTSDVSSLSNPKSVLLTQQPLIAAKGDGASTLIDFFAIRKYYYPEPALTIGATQYHR